MPVVNLTEGLRLEYQTLFDNCVIRAEITQQVEKLVQVITNNRTRYEKVTESLNIPWFVIAVIHNMEASLKFNCHLHNGDPLTSRTINVPSGRPISGNPPFTWEESAVDSLVFQKFDRWKNWTLPGVLYKLESYNGWGYRINHPEVLSPYLWSGSNHYINGKYIADGRWSDTAVSKQIGSAIILRRLAEKRIITFDKDFLHAAKYPLVYYSNKKTQYAEELQIFLNQFPGIYLKVDGIPGTKTSDAFKLFSGHFLEGDPRLN